VHRRPLTRRHELDKPEQQRKDVLTTEAQEFVNHSLCKDTFLHVHNCTKPDNGLIGDDFDGIFSNKDLCLTAVYWYPCMQTATRLIMPSFFFSICS